MSISILADQNMTKLQEISTLWDQDKYCKCIINSLHITLVHAEFFKHDNILYKVVQDGIKSFEALVAFKSTALTILVNSHNYQGHAGTNKNILSIQKRLLLEGYVKDKFIENCQIFKHHNLQKLSYSFIHITP